MTHETIECAHCLTEIKRGANICIGCKAEVRYGLSIGGFFGYLFGVFVLVVIVQIGITTLINMYGHHVGIDVEALRIWEKKGNNGFVFLYINLVVTLLLFSFLYVKYIRKSYKDYVSFRRLAIK